MDFFINPFMAKLQIGNWDLFMKNVPLYYQSLIGIVLSSNSREYEAATDETWEDWTKQINDKASAAEEVCPLH